ncbi:amino acid ABC transporter substrate-binding protein [Chitinimonas arctica]|uniref:Amino acid ABC transporter substrate-binding protein n=1 Tax=Chitinimonas arctica TaxID=2594795 RepID=A0A516SJX5_9NEIS|nr:transporter substrate-binding domain-containing protein [Chitinimonas arctica]QDQ28461.1 amino acid ABC transporter substrate-binding protein [Chitinimonas arctica]
MRLFPLIFAAAALTVSAADKPASIKLCYDNVEVYPWAVEGRDGLNIVQLKMAAQKLGTKLEFVKIPWARCLDELRQGNMDGAFAASFKPDRLAMGSYPGGGDKPDTSKYMMMDGYSLYRLKGSNVGYDGKAISNVTGAVGAQQGFSIVDQLKGMGVRVDDGTRSADDSLRKLTAGRLQAVALQTLEGDNSIQQAEFAGKVEKVSPPLVEKPYYLMLSKQFIGKYGDFSKEVWNTVAAVRDSAEYKKAAGAFK